ncbi:unnamed protein product [Rotaria sp. Silwood1]|nr:unnamed protein product [Rotaria sp. Silwood1]CAF1462264.1 unnamed protein product [Rotaria sp. Silwood1]CAF3606404.1 unnamed protein product [Rotaria sp. Silwood1]CAF3620778.1 unnamed protein product [Rotaria sp. Silwood1]CAF3652446.1 unnamed protein product [Rotaria sp. Silwood1]
MPNTALNYEIVRLQSIANIIDGYVMLVLIIVGTVGNLLNIFVFIYLKELRRMPNSIFLVSSFIGSLVLLWATRFPRSILAITNIDLLAISTIYCKLRWLFGRWGLNMPMTCVCLASIDRFLITSRNVRYRHLFTVQRARFIVIIFSIVYLVICMPDAIYYKEPSCTASASVRFIYKQFIAYFNLSITNALSLVVLALFSILTWNNLRLSRLVRCNRFQEQVNQMMLAEFIMVLLTTIPNFLYNIYSQATQSVIKSELRLAQENLWSTVSAAINFTMHTGTFYVYVIVSRAYRYNVRTAIRLKKRNRIQPKHTPIQHEQIGHPPPVTQMIH